jgi:hypothetical protein
VKKYVSEYERYFKSVKSFMKDLEVNVFNMKIEAESAHNDGWTQDFYRKRLLNLKKEIIDFANKIPNYKIHSQR